MNLLKVSLSFAVLGFLITSMGPASDDLTINVPPGYGKAPVCIYDLTGRVVFEAKAPVEGMISWDLTGPDGSRVPRGLYLVTYEGDEERVIKKVVVQ